MALNATHSFEELDGVKCAIVEKNVSPARVEFLKQLLELNGYTVVVTGTPPPKAKPVPPPKEGEAPAPVEPPPAPTSFTVGVTDVTFSVMNAVFNRELKAPNKVVVTAAYWRQEEDVPLEDEWYWFHQPKV
jgi:hypothetical protein